jgi:hypothetical protein
MERIGQAKSDRAPATEVNNNNKRQMSPPVSVPGISRQLSPARSKPKTVQGASATQDDSTQENALEPPVKGSKNSTGPKAQKAQKAQKAHPSQPSPLSRASKDSKASKPPTASNVSKDLNVSQKIPEGSSEDSQSSDDEADVKVKEENEDSNVLETSVILKVPNAPRQFESERQRDDSFKQDTTPIASEYSARSADHGKSKVKLEKLENHEPSEKHAKEVNVARPVKPMKSLKPNAFFDNVEKVDEMPKVSNAEKPEKARKAQKSPSSNMSPKLDTPLERSESASVPLPNPSKSTSMNLLSKLGLIVDGAKV